MELLLNGFIVIDYDDHPALIKDHTSLIYTAESIPRRIQQTFGSMFLNDEYLGKDITHIPNCSLTIWYTDKKCTFEEAQEALCNYLDGYMTVDVAYLGYSEYTITGYSLEEFRIGGHDLRKELDSHIGEYCWIRITSY